MILVLWFVVVVDLCGIYIPCMLVLFTSGVSNKLQGTSSEYSWSVHSYSQTGSMCRMTYDIGKSSHSCAGGKLDFGA